MSIPYWNSSWNSGRLSNKSEDTGTNTISFGNCISLRVHNNLSNIVKREITGWPLAWDFKFEQKLKLNFWGENFGQKFLNFIMLCTNHNHMKIKKKYFWVVLHQKASCPIPEYSQSIPHPPPLKKKEEKSGMNDKWRTIHDNNNIGKWGDKCLNIKFQVFFKILQFFPMLKKCPNNSRISRSDGHPE